jgi:hypothetical protein
MRKVGHVASLKGPSQALVTINQLTVTTHLVYTASVVAPDIVIPHLQRFDELAQAAFTVALNIDDLTPKQALQYSMKMTDGGFGFTNKAAQSIGLFLAAIFQSNVSHSTDQPIPSTRLTPTEKDHALNRYNAHVLPADVIPDWNALRLIDESKPETSTLAKTLNKRIWKRRKSLLLAGLPEAQVILLQSCAKPGVMTAVIHPTFCNHVGRNSSYRLMMTNSQARCTVLCHMVGGPDRFGQLIVPLDEPPAQMPADATCNRTGRDKQACQEVLDGNLHHTYHCRRGRYPLHQILLGALQQCVRTAGFPSSQDTKLRDSDVAAEVKARFADMRVDGITATSTFIDVTMASPFSKDNMASIIVNHGHRKVVVDAPVLHAEQSKNDKCLTSAAALNSEFIPFAVTHLGVVGPAACSFLKRLAEHINLLTGEEIDHAFQMQRQHILAAIFRKIAIDKLRALNRVRQHLGLAQRTIMQ